MFGEWTVEPEDELEVFIYRAGISVAAAGLITSAPLCCVCISMHGKDTTNLLSSAGRRKTQLLA